MTILTFDIEEWYLEASHGGREARYRVFDSYLNSILDLLEKEGKCATFFCLGRMATDFPDVVKRIASKGHEIGCHSDKHLWLNKMTPEQGLEDTRCAVDALEQCIGEKVVSYRAPAFSVGESNRWAFEVLSQCGIERDASIFPAPRDFGGFPNFTSEQPCIIKVGDAQIKEFPIPLVEIFGRKLAYSGGGYFRFFPLSFIKREMGKSHYSMTYFHIGDLVTEKKGLMSREDYEAYFKETGTLQNRLKRYIKSNLGKKSASTKLNSLISSTDFISISEADTKVDWAAAQVIPV